MKPIYTKTFRKVLTEFNKQKIKYIVLRNYEFVLDSKQPLEPHFDMVIQKEDMKKSSNILQKLDAIKYNPQFSLAHQGQGLFLAKEKLKIGFDIQNDGIYWNDMVYLTAAQIMPRRKKQGFIFTLSDEDAFIMYLCHSILGKRMFKEKYKYILFSLTKKNLDKPYIEKNLKRIFNKKIAKRLMKLVYKNDFKAIQKKTYSLVSYYILKKPKNWIIFTKLSFRWFFSRKYCPLKKIPLIKYLVPGTPMISIIGPDGSGKSTMSEMLVKILKKSERDVELVYGGRGKSNIIPIKRIGNIYKKVEKKKMKKKSFIKTIIYTIAAPIYTLDLLIRYFFKIMPKRRSEKIVVTDRYASDILLMANVPLWIKKILLSLFPKPTLTFYVYNTPEELYKRKGHSIEDLKRQLSLFPTLQKKFKAIPIKTQNKKKDFEKIAEITFRKLIKLAY